MSYGFGTYLKRIGVRLAACCKVHNDSFIWRVDPPAGHYREQGEGYTKVSLLVEGMSIILSLVNR